MWGKKRCNLTDFDHGMVDDARHTGLSISETDNLLGFSHTTIWSLHRIVGKNNKWQLRWWNCGEQKSISEQNNKAWDHILFHFCQPRTENLRLQWAWDHWNWTDEGDFSFPIFNCPVFSETVPTVASHFWPKPVRSFSSDFSYQHGISTNRTITHLMAFLDCTILRNL